MRREIKFRGRYSQGIENAGHWVYWGLTGTDVLDCIDLDTVGQYTGLKDKNGVEIYEGDVAVKEGYLHFDDGKPNYRSEVEWCFAGFHTVLHCVNPSKRGISDGINESLEEGRGWLIIGNIHSNPELLEKELQ